MLIAFIVILILALVYGPQLWVRGVMKYYDKEIKDMPGTGGELAQHLVERFELPNTQVETTEQWKDHYDPKTKKVRLSPTNYNKKSLTAIAVATHEVGHAMQDVENNKWMKIRTKYYPFVYTAERIAITILYAVPIMLILTRSPIVTFIMIGAGLMFFLTRVFFHGVTLPMELDASFNKALPLLIKENYVPKSQQKAVRRVLRAAAMTYIASALADMLSVWRWLLIFRGRWI